MSIQYSQHNNPPSPPPFLKCHSKKRKWTRRSRNRCFLPSVCCLQKLHERRLKRIESPPPLNISLLHGESAGMLPTNRVKIAHEGSNLSERAARSGLFGASWTAKRKRDTTTSISILYRIMTNGASGYDTVWIMEGHIAERQTDWLCSFLYPRRWNPAPPKH